MRYFINLLFSVIRFGWVGSLFVFALSSLTAQIEGEGEFFTVFLDDYFTERQGGQVVSLRIEYKFYEQPARETMPDYRAVQILVEDLLYEEGDPDLYWELVNRELVRRLLVAHPQIAEVESRFTVSPRRELTIFRHSRVRYGRDVLGWLGEAETFRNDAYYQLAEGREVILVPRPFKAWYDSQRVPFYEAGSSLDISCTQLNGSESVIGSLVAMIGGGAPWTAIVLPRQPEGFPLRRGREVGKVEGLVMIHNPEAISEKIVVESGLAGLLGTLAKDVETGTLAETREDFFLNNRYRSMITTRTAAGVYMSLKWPMVAFAEEESLFLYVR
jgi:hypothetical protein